MSIETSIEARSSEGRAVFSPVFWKDDALCLIDQTRLPDEERWLTITSVEEVADAIRRLVVRGAPAIGIAAAYGVALAARTVTHVDKLQAAIALLAATRPTAVNLFWALRRMERRITGLAAASPAAFRAELLAEAEAIRAEDIAACKEIGRLGAALLPDPCAVLTHCNAGALATGGYGTALGVIRAAVEAGKRIQVFADETRPLLQGARLTAWELMRDGIPVTLVCDDMAGRLMQLSRVDFCLVGADRIARNGDTANKIGTYGVAVLAHHHRIPFAVAAPFSTVDLSVPSGREIPIEERAACEVTTAQGTCCAPAGVAVFNPAFDVTPVELIHAIVTERGVARRPAIAADLARLAAI